MTRSTPPAEAPEQFPIVDRSTQHVLIVELDGSTYIAPHHYRPDLQRCHDVYAAFEAFRTRVTYPAIDGGPMLPAVAPDGEPGRYWCDVDEDGNFTIGSRIPTPGLPS